MFTKQIIARNTIANFVGRVAQIGIAIVLTPFMLKYLGLEIYGVWVILSAITNYYGLFDFGLSSTYIKFIAEYKAKEDWIRLKETIATGFYFSLVVGVIILSIGFLVKDNLLSFFIHDYRRIPHIQFIYCGMLLLFCLAYLGQFFQSILNGYQRMELTNISMLIQRLLNFVLVLVFLIADKGLYGLVLAGIISWFFLIVINYYQAKKICPQLSLSVCFLNKQALSKLMSYGWNIQITQCAGWVLNNVDKLFLGYFTSPAVVSAYDIAYRLRNFSREPVASYIGTITPAASSISANYGVDSDAIRAFYMKISNYLMLFILPLSVFMFVNAGHLVRLWVGPGFADSIIVLQILLIGNFFNLLTGCGTHLARGINRPGLEARYAIWITVLTALLGYFLTKHFGLIGLSIGSSLALGIPSIWFVFSFNRYLRIQQSLFLKKIILRPLLVVVSIGLIDGAFDYMFKMDGTSRIIVAVILSSKFAIYCSVCLFILIRGRVTETFLWVLQELRANGLSGMKIRS